MLQSVKTCYAHENRLEFHDFDGGLEIRPTGINKGQVVESVLKTVSAGAAVAYLGDDLTDEHAFEALGQRGLSVLVKSSPRPRETRAAIRLNPPDELIEFMACWLDAGR